MPSQHPKPASPQRPGAAVSLATHLHSGVIASVSYAYFQRLVDDPPSTLLCTLPLLAATQAVYAVLCLEPGFGAAKGRRSKAPPKKGEYAAAGISCRILVCLFSGRGGDSRC